MQTQINPLINLKSNYNPDVLSCLANLSNDEVFTPPELVNRILDLLPNELWQKKEVRFLDPVSKSGVFLREIAKRLNEGLKGQIPDQQTRINHIFSKQIYGLAITELTALLARRSVYCSKKADSEHSICEAFDNHEGNIKYRRIKHTWQSAKCIYCGASQEVYDRDESLESHAYEFIHTTNPNQIFGNEMKFDVIVGNPPYQLNDGGAQASAMPLYHKFVQQAKKLNPRYLSMIIPSRWFAGGKGLDDFRDEMLNDSSIREIHDFLNASDCFPGVDIKGGVCFFLWDRDNKGPCKVSTHEAGAVISVAERPLLEGDSDIFIRYNQAIPILHKVKAFNEKSFSSLVSTRKPFGFATNFKAYKKNEFDGSVKIYANNKDLGHIEKSSVKLNQQWIDKHKLFVPYAIGSGDSKTDIIKTIYATPGSCCTETYLVIGPFSSKEISENVQSYINTKFFHFLITLRKNTQHTTKPVYQFVPVQDFSEVWTDQKLYKKYGLTEEEVNFIESMVHPSESRNE
jgi:hypothetical protein